MPQDGPGGARGALFIAILAALPIHNRILAQPELQHPLPLIAATCSVVIRPTDDYTVDYDGYSLSFLNVAEIKLYAAGGTQIAPVSVDISSMYNDGSKAYLATNAVDNDPGTFVYTANGDPYPMLTVRYDCPGGNSTADRVVVLNHDDPCCRSWLLFFTLDFLDAGGKADTRLAYEFMETQPVYTVWGRRELSLSSVPEWHAVLASHAGPLAVCLLQLAER